MIMNVFRDFIPRIFLKSFIPSFKKIFMKRKLNIETWPF